MAHRSGELPILCYGKEWRFPHIYSRVNLFSIIRDTDRFGENYSESQSTGAPIKEIRRRDSGVFDSYGCDSTCVVFGMDVTRVWNVGNSTTSNI